MALRRRSRTGTFGADQPITVGAGTLLAAVLAVLLRLRYVAHGASGVFVVAGREWANPAQTPTNLPILPGAGYDGQFYYRFALDPLKLGAFYRGIRLDTAYRRSRIGYSALAWVGSVGQARFLPTALIAVNVVALGILGYVSAVWAQSLGRRAVWGLLPASFFGFVWSLSRDLTEIVAALFLVTGLLLVQKSRPLCAGVALGAAILCRETVAVVILAFAAVRVLELTRRSRRFGSTDATWMLPTLMFAAWQVYCRAAYGTFPVLDERGTVTVPFRALFHAVATWVTHPAFYGLVQLAQLTAVGFLVVLALASLRQSTVSAGVRLAFVLALLLAVSLAASVWNADPDEFRTLSDLWILASGVLLGARRTWLLRAATTPLLSSAALWSVAVELRTGFL